MCAGDSLDALSRLTQRALTTASDDNGEYAAIEQDAMRVSEALAVRLDAELDKRGIRYGRAQAHGALSQRTLGC